MTVMMKMMTMMKTDCDDEHDKQDAGGDDVGSDDYYNQDDQVDNAAFRRMFIMFV